MGRWRYADRWMSFPNMKVDGLSAHTVHWCALNFPVLVFQDLLCNLAVVLLLKRSLTIMDLQRAYAFLKQLDVHLMNQLLNPCTLYSKSCQEISKLSKVWLLGWGSVDLETQTLKAKFGVRSCHWFTALSSTCPSLASTTRLGARGCRRTGGCSWWKWKKTKHCIECYTTSAGKYDVSRYWDWRKKMSTVATSLAGNAIWPMAMRLDWLQRFSRFLGKPTAGVENC